ncbi:MAG: hypothetical protein OSB70_02690 [Myxococcota bacterium]|nr:hypothetical protein [Myxococcota bacterium]
MDDPHAHDWPYFCEENAWHRCAGPLGQLDGASVVFISNAARSVALWQQKTSPDPEQAVLWDYHVIFLARRDGIYLAWDPDSTLTLPTPASHYLEASLPSLPAAWETHAPRFRWLPAALYLRELKSDRRHMRAAGGGWLQPPPPGPCIGEGSNLMRFVDTQSEYLGELLDLPALRKRLVPPTLP